MPATLLVFGLPKALPGPFTQLLGGRPRERPVEFIGMGQQPDIIQSIEAAKPLDGALASVKLPRVARLLNQPLHLNP